MHVTIVEPNRGPGAGLMQISPLGPLRRGIPLQALRWIFWFITGLVGTILIALLIGHSIPVGALAVMVAPLAWAVPFEYAARRYYLAVEGGDLIYRGFWVSRRVSIAEIRGLRLTWRSSIPGLSRPYDLKIQIADATLTWNVDPFKGKQVAAFVDELSRLIQSNRPNLIHLPQ